MLRTQGVAPNLGADTHLFVTKPDAALGRVLRFKRNAGLTP
jgi:hypothetical protein